MPSDDVATVHVQVPGQRDPQPASSGMWRLIELEPPGGREFDDAKYEWRRLFSGLLGTFLLVLAGAGGAVVNAQSGGPERPGRSGPPPPRAPSSTHRAAGRSAGLLRSPPRR